MFVQLSQAYYIVFFYSSVMVNQNHRPGVVMQLLSYVFSIRRMQMGICFVAVSKLIFRLRSPSVRTRSSFQGLSSDFFLIVFIE